MELLAFIITIITEYKLELGFVFFLFFCLYIHSQNKKEYEKMISEKEKIKESIHDTRKRLAELWIDEENDRTLYERELKYAEKEIDYRIKDIQENFNSASLMSINSCVGVIILFLIIFLLPYFLGITNG